MYARCYLAPKHDSEVALIIYFSYMFTGRALQAYSSIGPATSDTYFFGVQCSVQHWYHNRGYVSKCRIESISSHALLVNVSSVDASSSSLNLVIFSGAVQPLPA